MRLSIEQFDGGIQRDVRSRTVGGCAMSRHFDHTVAPNKLVPRRDYESHNDLNGVTDGIEARTITCLGYADSDGLYDSTGTSHNDIVIGIGKKASGTGCAVFFTEIDGDTAGWLSGYDGTTTILETSDVDPDHGPLVEVPATSSVFFFPSNTGDDIGLLDFSYPITLDGDIAVTDNEGGNWDHVRGPDANYYITRWVTRRSTGTGTNCIDQVNSNGTVTEDVFCVQPSTSIMNLARNGNYLGLMCVDFSRDGQPYSELQIWDTVNDDPISIIPWGPGRTYWLEEIDGDWLAVTAEHFMFDERFGNGDYRMVLRASRGGAPAEITSIPAFGAIETAEIIPRTHKRADEFLFYARLPLDATPSTYEEGLWSVRKSASGQYALTLAYDTSSLGVVQSWIGVGNHAYFIHDTTYSASRINTSESYTITSSYETLYNPEMPQADYFREKVLETFRIKCEPLPADGQIVVKYRKDEETSWTTIATITTDDLITHEITNIESTGAPLPDFKEIQFRLESTGGAVIVGYEYRYDTLSDHIHG